MTEAEVEARLGRACFHLWPTLPRDIQERVFEQSAGSDATVRNELAVFLHDRHPRTLHPPKPTKMA